MNEKHVGKIEVWRNMNIKPPLRETINKTWLLSQTIIILTVYNNIMKNKNLKYNQISVNIDIRYNLFKIIWMTGSMVA